MRKKKKSEGNGFNVWRSYSDMMAGVLLLFVLIMCVTLFQAQKSYNESLQERDEKIAMQEQYTQELLDTQNAIDEKNETLQNQDEPLKTQEEKLAEQQKQLEALAAKLKEQESTLNAQQTALDEKTAQLKDQQAQIDQIIGVKADVIEALKNEFSTNNINVDIDAQTGALTLEASVMFDYDQAELTIPVNRHWSRFFRSTVKYFCRMITKIILQRSLLMDTQIQTEITVTICSFLSRDHWQWHRI